GEMGGGDVKLFGAIGALSGPILGFDAEGSAFVVALAIVLPWRLWKARAFRSALRNCVVGIGNAFRSKDHRVAYAPIRTLPPVIMGPSILAGYCLMLVRHWPLS